MSLLLLLNPTVWGEASPCPSLTAVTATSLSLTTVTEGSLTLTVLATASAYPNHPNCYPGICIPGDDEGILTITSVTEDSLSLASVSETALSLSVVTPCEG
jgi:hypothetical protein